MKASEVDKVVEPLVQRGLFETTESAVRGLAQDYILRQIVRYQETIDNMEQRYGMDYDQFIRYLKQRAALLQSTGVSPEQRESLNQAVMLEEEDALEWKIAREMLQSWLGLKGEVEPSPLTGEPSSDLPSVLEQVQRFLKGRESTLTKET